jgi:hypothetical protein
MRAKLQILILPTLLLMLVGAPGYAEEAVAPLPVEAVAVQTDELDNTFVFQASIRPEEGTPQIPVTCTVDNKGRLVGTYHYGGLVKVDGAYSIASSCDRTLWRIYAQAGLTRNGGLVSQGPYFSCDSDNCTRGVSSSTYTCASAPPGCAGTYIVASFLSLKLYDNYYFTQYPRGCSLYESDSRIICNPLKSTPMYMPAYK